MRCLRCLSSRRSTSALPALGLVFILLPTIALANATITTGSKSDPTPIPLGRDSTDAALDMTFVPAVLAEIPHTALSALYFELRNNGAGDAESVRVSPSISNDWTFVEAVDNHGLAGQFYAAGGPDSIYDVSGDPMLPEYPLVEWTYDLWPAGETKSFRLAVQGTGPAPDQFLNVRWAWQGNTLTRPASEDDSSFVGFFPTLDQQSYWAWRYPVTIAAPPDSLEVPVLVYHNIDEISYSEYWVTTTNFVAQLELLEFLGYVPVRYSDLLAYGLGQGSLPAKPVILTLDDGVLSQYENALPIMLDHGVIGMFGLITGRIGESEVDRQYGFDPDAPDPVPYLIWPEIEALVSAGMEIASHTRTHPQLPSASDSVAIAELRNSAEDIHTRLGIAPDALVYPGGLYDSRVQQFAAGLGYRSALAVGCGTENVGGIDWYAVSRVCVEGEDNLGQFWIKLDPDHPRTDLTVRIASCAAGSLAVGAYAALYDEERNFLLGEGVTEGDPTYYFTMWNMPVFTYAYEVTNQPVVDETWEYWGEGTFTPQEDWYWVTLPRTAPYVDAYDTYDEPEGEVPLHQFDPGDTVYIRVDLLNNDPAGANPRPTRLWAYVRHDGVIVDSLETGVFEIDPQQMTARVLPWVVPLESEVGRQYDIMARVESSYGDQFVTSDRTGWEVQIQIREAPLLTVEWVHPDNGAPDVPADEVISVLFNLDISSAEINAETFRVVGPGGQEVGTYAEPEPGYFEFTATESLACAAEYTCTLSGDISGPGQRTLDGNGNGIPEGSPEDDYVWTFYTTDDSPGAAFSPSYASACDSAYVCFENLTPAGPEGTYLWIFGDGETSSEFEPCHAFPDSGRYEIRLIAHGCGSDTARGGVLVTTEPPIAGFDTFLPERSLPGGDGGHPGDPAGDREDVIGCAPLEVCFVDQSLGDVESFLWEFGDGEVDSSSADPCHTYAYGDSFTVRLIVCNPCGCDTLTRVDHVQAHDPPVACFTADADSVAADSTICFHDCSSGDHLTRTWFFGDGADTTGISDPCHVYNSPGTVIVELVVVGEFCGADTASMEIVVLPAWSSVDPDEGVDGDGCEDPSGGCGQWVTHLQETRPNPASRAMAITFTVGEPAEPVRLSVHDVAGRRVRSLVYQMMGSGRYEIRWDGRDDGGAHVAAGLYFIRLETARRAQQRKAMLLR